MVLVESAPDPASVGIAAALRAAGGWRETSRRFADHAVWRREGTRDVRLVRTPSLHIQAEGVDVELSKAGIEPTAIVFLSKHKSESGRPTLTAHPIGNFRAADFGGAPGRLSPTSGPVLSQALRCLAAARDAHGFAAEVSFEATHHGPLLSTPAIFFELGSGEAQWNDPTGHRVVADAAARLVATEPPPFPVVVGLGGGHYGPRFTEAVLTKAVHIAHMLPTYHANAVTDRDGIARELAAASPGARSYYYHDGTLPKDVRDAWFAALSAAGLASVRSKEWLPIQSAVVKPTQNISE